MGDLEDYFARRMRENVWIGRVGAALLIGLAVYAKAHWRELGAGDAWVLAGMAALGALAVGAMELHWQARGE